MRRALLQRVEERRPVRPSSVPLVILTDHYPFDVGEEFFEQEIGYLARAFERIWIVPIRAGAVKTRRLPPQATAVRLPGPARPWKQSLPRLLPQLAAGPGRIEVGNLRRSPTALVREAHYATDVLERTRALTRSRFYREDLVGGPMLVYAYWLHTAAGVAQMLKATHGAPVVAVSRAHAYDVDEADAAGGHLPGRRRLVRGLDEIYPISRYARSFLEPYRAGEGGAGIEIRHLGVPASPAGPAGGQAAEGRDPGLHLVSCSHLAPYKRVDRLADAVGVLSRHRPVRWTHIGERDEGRLDAMRDHAARVAPRARVELLGYQSNERTRELLASSGFTMLVNTSSGEGVPVSIMEAMSAGLPVVATDVGGTAEIVRDGRNGHLVPAAATPEDIARAIASIADAPPSQRAAMGAEARRTWDEEFNAERQYTAMAERLGRLAAALEAGARS
ncbi:colanic acid biosynthesis glycosyltransferase WcaL [Actinomyces slackii]|uniref:Colanic acid biosynthesis glycosyltransferase WcaL n=1 Tax=Actinomyces slackii TaxID=52774 RepID=A0A448KG53_9ACTO|nr:colanic acid biosynthesis glycosyltransferase WcaL [Actinomyces slackii]